MLIKYSFLKKNPMAYRIHFKFFIGYNDNDVIRPLCVKLPQMTGYAKKFEFNLTMSYKISNKELLKNDDQIWKRTENLLKVKFGSKHVYDDDQKYIKTKIEKYDDSDITNFYNKKCQNKKHHASVYQ